MSENFLTTFMKRESALCESAAFIKEDEDSYDKLKPTWEYEKALGDIDRYIRSTALTIEDPRKRNAHYTVEKDTLYNMIEDLEKEHGKNFDVSGLYTYIDDLYKIEDDINKIKDKLETKGYTTASPSSLKALTKKKPIMEASQESQELTKYDLKEGIDLFPMQKN